MYIEKIPIEIQNKIFLYLEHPISKLIKDDMKIYDNYTHLTRGHGITKIIDKNNCNIKGIHTYSYYFNWIDSRLIPTSN
jgi:hypothetical protein